MRLALAGLVVAACAVAGLDLSRPPTRQWSARALVSLVDAYRDTVSPHLHRVVGPRCRFRPSCSRYAADAIRRTGTVRGLALTVRRLARCGPWTPAGTIDPPPPRTSR